MPRLCPGTIFRRGWSSWDGSPWTGSHYLLRRACLVKAYLALRKKLPISASDTSQTPGVGLENRRQHESWIWGCQCCQHHHSQWSPSGLLGESEKTTWCCLLKCRCLLQICISAGASDNLHLHQLLLWQFSPVSWIWHSPMSPLWLLSLSLWGGKRSFLLNNQDLAKDEDFSSLCVPQHEGGWGESSLSVIWPTPWKALRKSPNSLIWFNPPMDMLCPHAVQISEDGKRLWKEQSHTLYLSH